MTKIMTILDRIFMPEIVNIIASYYYKQYRYEMISEELFMQIRPVFNNYNNFITLIRESYAASKKYNLKFGIGLVNMLNIMGVKKNITQWYTIRRIVFNSYIKANLIHTAVCSTIILDSFKCFICRQDDNVVHHTNFSIKIKDMIDGNKLAELCPKHNCEKIIGT